MLGCGAFILSFKLCGDSVAHSPTLKALSVWIFYIYISILDAKKAFTTIKCFLQGM